MDTGKGKVALVEGRPWESGYNESSNGKLGDEMLNGQIFYDKKLTGH